MATNLGLFVPSKAPSINTEGLLPGRPPSSLSFDAGLNASSAWTGHIDHQSSGDESETKKSLAEIKGDTKDEILDVPRAARALYDFEGKPEFRELAVKAGDALQIHKETLADGWSLAQFKDNMGLIPQKYYVFTSDFVPSPLLAATVPDSDPPMNILQPQTTGPYFSTLRQTFLGGKSLNRFSNFVTCGAEDYVLNGNVNHEDFEEGAFPSGHGRNVTEGSSKDHNGQHPDEEGHVEALTQSVRISEADQHFVETPPAWRSKAPPFRILVHSPSKRTSTLSGSYTIYAVTSLFLNDPNSSYHSRFTSSSSNSSIGTDNTPRSRTPTIESHSADQLGEPAHTHVTVYRRFSQFVFLHAALSRRLPGIALPPLPEKQYAGRFSDDFVEARRGDLERWISRVSRHPVARYSEVLVFFLSCDNEAEWRRDVPRHMTPMPSPGPYFYGHVYHPAFNLDAEDASEAVKRFQRHLKAVGAGVHGLRNVFTKVREAGLEASVAQRALSYSILSLITSTPIENANGLDPTPSLAYGSRRHILREQDEDDENDELGEDVDPRKGLMNDDGAWCWKDDCAECLRVTKALQRMAEILQSVADIHDDHARRRQLATHEALKDVSHPFSLYEPVIDTHQATLSRYTEASEHESSAVDHEKAARCETVLNTTMAEFETYHVQKREDFTKIATEHLDGEIAFHEQILSRLKAARAAFEPPKPVLLPTSPTHSPSASHFTSSTLPMGPRQPSIYERDLSALRRPVAALPQPAPHVHDSVSTIRPVSFAVREGMGMLLGGVGVRAAGNSTSAFRGSVFDFSRFWSS